MIDGVGICGDVVACFVFVYMVFRIMVSYRCRKGTDTDRKETPI